MKRNNKENIKHTNRLKTQQTEWKQSLKTDWTIKSIDTLCKSTDQPTDSQPKCKKHQNDRQHESLAHYFLSQIKMVIQQLSRFNRQRITYMDYLQILRQLNMIQHNYEPVRDDAASRLWAILVQPSKDNSTCLVNLSIILMAVMNISLRISSVVEFYECIEHKTQNSAVIGNFKKTQSSKQYTLNKDGYFDLSDHQVEEIHTKFQEFRTTRMYLGQISRKSEKEEQRSSNRPTSISKKGRSLGKSKTDFHSTQSIDQCTFQPNISRALTNRFAGNIRSNRLYKISSRQKKQDRSKDDIEYEKSPQSYTFKPIISTRKSKEKTKPIKGQTKEIQRMLKARLDKEVKQVASSKGMPYIKKNIDKIRKDLTLNYTLPPQRNLLFTFEVYMEQQSSIDKIMMYEGDDVNQVARHFAHKHNLKPHLQSKLLSTLREHVSNLEDGTTIKNLKEIEEESIESSLDL